MGLIDTSASGGLCLDWTDFEGISFPYTEEIGVNNFCRMASSLYEKRFDQPWCYTEEGPESCNIPFCGE